MTQQKKTLVWDYDDIIYPFLRTFFVTFHNAQYGSSFSFKDINTYELEHIIGCDWHEKQRRINEFYGSRYHNEMLPMPGAIEAAVALSPYYTHVIVTARPLFYKPQTRMLLERDAPRGLFEEEIHFLDHYADKDGVKLSKGDTCVEIGAAAAVEDGLHNAKSIAGKGIPVYLPDMPWNQSEPIAGVTRVRHWDEIVAALIKRESAPAI